LRPNLQELDNMTEGAVATAVRLGIAALIGLVIGLEREWSGHASGVSARFAGLRTFLLIGLLGGCAGLLAREGHDLIAAAIVFGTAGMAIAAYVVATRAPDADRDGTTEVAAILVAALGVIAGAGSWAVAAGAGSLVVLVLHEKQRLHGAVTRVQPAELSAALRFAVLALVVLPLLPEGPYLGWAAIRPRSLWFIVLLFSAINFAGFLARRTAEEGRGYLLTGLLGGVISSTAVAFGFARFSTKQKEAGAALAIGVIGACTVLVPRVLVVSAVLNQEVAIRLAPLIVPAGLIGAAIVAFAWKYGARWLTPATTDAPVQWLAGDDRSPLRLWVAIRLAILFQLAIMAITLARSFWSVQGVYGSAVVLGLTDVDALTVSMSTPSTAIAPMMAARAIGVGILANTIVKLGIAVAAGSGRFRLIAGAVLLGMAAITAAMLALL
jgi:uncharacterized membrane protein (DUF4010 family)